jgi:hypothetical protein
MAKLNSFLSETAQTASFAFREYFRPLIAVAGFLKSRLGKPAPAAPPVEDGASLGAAKVSRRQNLPRRAAEDPPRTRT